MLGPLLTEDNQLLLYLQHGHNVTTSAQILHVHRNTVLYRIGQAEWVLEPATQKHR
ncbi:MAG: hypothetical protein C7B46_13060 [Sulfobacillus benefaciens]|uniref:PucR C-terminal helix-turn-helix domain-containing protein n=1 Tax=Sulfobacillus benefaciens TaxID=453960 RepID=A0A2T2XDT8_9FIRM|nr:MAG: hypothetical protein C7B46_13060 [Sulfobacillus benefaciens]